MLMCDNDHLTNSSRQSTRLGALCFWRKILLWDICIHPVLNDRIHGYGNVQYMIWNYTHTCILTRTLIQIHACKFMSVGVGWGECNTDITIRILKTFVIMRSMTCFTDGPVQINDRTYFGHHFACRCPGTLQCQAIYRHSADCTISCWATEIIFGTWRVKILFTTITRSSRANVIFIS